MSILELSWKFFTRRAGTNKLNFSSFLPIVGVSLGTLTIILTFAIMDGLERDIFGTLKNFSGGAIIKTNNISENGKKILENYIKENNINYSSFIERKAIIQFGEESRIVNIRALSNLKLAMKGILEIKTTDINSNSIIIGHELSNRLNITNSDSLKIISPLDLKFSSTAIPQHDLIVYDIFMTGLLDFDLNYVFIPIEVGKNLFKKSGNIGFYIKNKIELPEEILNINNLEFKYWDDIHKNLVGAMRMEKMAYVAFGFLLILISGFSLLSTMSIFVMQKISQIGILKTIGYSETLVKLIFFYFSLISGLIGVFIGITLAYLVKFTEDKNPFFYLIFGDYPYLEFPILLNSGKIFWVGIVSVIAIILASVYPAMRASKLNPVYSIGIK